MRKFTSLFLIINLFLLSSIGSSEENKASLLPARCATDYVDVFVGTEGDNGQLYPGATVPFGLVKLSPDTSKQGHAGYDFSDVVCKGFSHTRLGGVGCSGAGGSVKVKPALGKTLKDTLNKATEKGHPGYYGVTFTNGIQVDLTVSCRVGFHQYTFPESTEGIYIHIDPTQNYAGRLDSSWTKISNNLITGHTKGKNVCGHSYYKLYYAAKFDQDFMETEADGDAVWCKFPPAGGGKVIKIKVGISPISAEQAVIECDNDIAGWDFNAAKTKAENLWKNTLDKIEIPDVPAELEEFRDLFYTCLYRCYLLPHNVTSSDGKYRMAGDEGTVRQVRDTAPDYVHYSGWSTWDDYRKFSLISLLEPEIAHNIVRSIVEWFQGRNTPAWADGYWPCPSVRTEFINTIVLDAYQKGLTEYDLQDAYDGLVSSIQGNVQVEKPYQYYVTMKIAELLGKTDDAKKYKAEALKYRDFWANSQVDGQGAVRGFFTADGNPVPQSKVDAFSAGFYEGNLWHYRFFVPHDVQGLINLRGSRELLADDLEYYFSNWMHTPLNEPPLAYPFLFDYLGKPYRTQYWSRTYITDVVTNLYHNHGKFPSPVVRRVYEKKPAGWLPTMDDDTGAMSSQFVFSALGLYPACMGDSYYVIGSPLFPKTVLNVGNGKTFVIKANHSTLANKYIQSAALNGKPYDKTWIDYKTIQQGGVLEFEMKDQPNPNWGKAPGSAPPSLSPVNVNGNAGQHLKR